MEGVPAEILEQHRNRIIQNFYQAQENRRIATGNPLPGQSAKNPRKKIKIETMDQLMERFTEHRATVKTAKAAGVNGGDANGAVPVSSPYLAICLFSSRVSADLELRTLLILLPISSSLVNQATQCRLPRAHNNIPVSSSLPAT